MTKIILSIYIREWKKRGNKKLVTRKLIDTNDRKN